MTYIRERHRPRQGARRRHPGSSSSRPVPPNRPATSCPANAPPHPCQPPTGKPGGCGSRGGYPSSRGIADSSCHKNIRSNKKGPACRWRPGRGSPQRNARLPWGSRFVAGGAGWWGWRDAFDAGRLSAPEAVVPHEAVIGCHRRAPQRFVRGQDALWTKPAAEGRTDCSHRRWNGPTPPPALPRKATTKPAAQCKGNRLTTDASLKLRG